MLKEFRDFAFKGNMIDMATGIIIGGAFGLAVKSLVDNIVMPIFSGVIHVPDFGGLFIPLDGKEYASLEELTKAGAPAIKYGVFVNNLVNLILVAAVLFFALRYTVEKLKKKPADAPPPAPPKSELLLEEIRDLLKARVAREPNVESQQRLAEP